MASSEAQEEPKEDRGIFTDADLIQERPADAPPKKKRGRPRKTDKKEEPLNRKRPFVESQVATSLAQSDVTSVMNRWDWDSAEYECVLSRAQPQSYQGRNCHGYIASFTHAIDEDYIGQHFGGGTYDIKVRGPNPKTGNAKTFLDGCRVRIAGHPILSDADRDYITPDGQGIIMANPTKGPPSGKHRRAAAAGLAVPWMESGSNGSGEEKDMVRMTFDRLSDRERQASEEARELREQLLKNTYGSGNGGNMSQQSLKILQDATDRAIEAEKRAADRQREEFERIRQEEKENKREFEQLVTRLGNRNTGIPPEMLQTLNESHRSEINALNESHRAEMRQERDRTDRELATIHERYKAEINAIEDKYREELQRTRSDLQSRLDREIDSSKREIDKIREDLTRRLDDKEKDHRRHVEQEREQARLRLEASESRAKSEREVIISQHQMQIEHLKSLQAGQIEQQKGQYESQLAQINATHEASLKMQENTLKAQVSALTTELERTRNDLQSTQLKVNEQGDLAAQASKLREIGDSLGSVFGLGKPAEMNVTSMPSMDIEPKKKRPEGWMGSLMDFADSNLGQMAFEFFKQAAVGAGPVPGMMPPGLPGQYGPPPGTYGPPGGYPSPQPNPYGGMPQQASPYGPSPVYGPQPQPPFKQPQGPYSNMGHGEFADEGYEEEENYDIQDAGPEDEGAFETEIRDNVVTAKPRPAPQSEPEPEPTPAPASSAPKPPQMEAPKSADDIPPEVRQQLEGLIQGLESAMTNGQSPEELADTILQMAPAEQLKPFASTPINKLAEDVSSIVPGTLLASYNGRKYLQKLQDVLSKKIGA